VEHPVTESVTGVDLVHEQIRLAIDPAYRLPEIRGTEGHSIEVRVYAEDAAQGFIPVTGRVDHLIWPSGPGIRIDRGVEVGQEMGTQFDSMCAKLIVKASTRELAVKRMQYVLRETVISGIGTNLEYLNAIAHDPRVVAGKVSTLLLDREFKTFAPVVEEGALDLIEAFEHSESFRSGGVGPGASPAGASDGAAFTRELWSKTRL
jgi:acetyl/propionyl-CoA carboxylase alpha subunit